MLVEAVCYKQQITSQHAYFSTIAILNTKSFQLVANLNFKISEKTFCSMHALTLSFSLSQNILGTNFCTG